MPDALWTSEEIAAATAGTVHGEFACNGISIDTRTLQPRDLFVALADVRDGHDFVEAAFKAGAAGALVSRPIEAGPYVLVDDVLEALVALGIAARQRAAGCYRVAVTGSVGKTSVKEMIARIFRAAGRAHWSEKSYNNQWGVPLSLARMPRDAQFAVFEVGMSTPGEIAPRSAMIAPAAAMITKIAPAHLEGLGSVEGVAREKAEIFSGLQAGGAAILPADDTFFALLKSQAEALQPDCRILTFGRDPGCDGQLVGTSSDGHRTHVDARILGRPTTVQLDVVGDHWGLNAVAALLASADNAPDAVTEQAAALSGYVPPPGRGTAETLTLPGGGSAVLIDDAYNANPESMRAALRGFGQRPCAGRRIVALGEMLEVGATSADEHLALAGPIMAAGADIVLLAGQGMKPLADQLSPQLETRWAASADGLDDDLKFMLKHGDLLLLKGSNASGMGRLADRLRQWSAAADRQVMERGAESAARGENAV